MDSLPNFDQLRCACLRVSLDFAAFRPLIRLVVMIDVAQQQASSGLVNDQTNVPTHADGPEVRIFRFRKFVKLQTRMTWIQLEIKRRSLYGLLLVARQSGKAVSERVCNSEFHFGSGHSSHFCISRKWAIHPTYTEANCIHVRHLHLPTLNIDIHSLAQPTERLKALVWCPKCLND